MKVKEQSDGMVMFWCVGCGFAHAVPTKGSIAWGFNGDTRLPTITPSILINRSPDGNIKRCHSFVRDGKQQYLADCDHSLAGKTVDIPDWDQAHREAK